GARPWCEPPSRPAPKRPSRTSTMLLDTEELLVSTLTTGMPGSGKSVSAVAKAARGIQDRSAAIVCMDKQGATNKEIAVQAKYAGRSRDLIIDRLSNFERPLGGITCKTSAHPNPIRREAEELKRMTALIDALWAAARRDGEEKGNWRSMPQMN